MIPTDNLDGTVQKILQLPPNWWQSMHSASILLQWFRTHIVPMLVAGEVNAKTQYTVYTGLILEHNERIVWLTAGHVIDELRQLLSSSNFKLSAIAWLDKFHGENADNINLHRTDIPMNSWKATGLDIGAAILSVLDAGNIKKNKNITPINSKIWGYLTQADPEGYYAIGFPRPWTSHSQKKISKQKILHSVKADLVCLPLEETAPPPEFANDPKWSDREAFYGKILPFTDNPAFEVDDIKGMSGGPILSIERDSKGLIAYRLVGIIQSCASGQSIIRAEPIHRVSQTLDKWLKELDGTKTLNDAENISEM